MGTQRVGLVKAAALAVTNTQLYQIVLELRDKINELIDERTTGFATLINGVATVKSPMVQPTSVIHLECVKPIGIPGVRLEALSNERVPGYSFVVRSTSIFDSSIITWEVVND